MSSESANAPVRPAPKRIMIKNGEVCGFADEVSFDGLEVTDFTKTRVSHVVPVRWLPCLAFLALRAVFSSDSRAAEWTRRWRCDWTVIIKGKKYGRFSDRAAAIAFEKEEIYRQGTMKDSVESSAEVPFGLIIIDDPLANAPQDQQLNPHIKTWLAKRASQPSDEPQGDKS